MRLRVAPLILGVLSVGAVAPLAAQLRASRPAAQPRNLPRLLVANPHTFQASDSAAAVRIGHGMRDKLNGIADRWYMVIERDQMNDALTQYGYPPDAVLPPLVARQLGSQLQARASVISTLAREGGQIKVESRVLSGNDQTGHLVTATQVAGQSPEDLGGKLAESMKGAFNALPDAKACFEESQTNPSKAADAARKAIRAQPNHALAELCLAQLAVTRKAPVDEILGHYKNATEGDRYSLEAWGGLLGQYQVKGDTANIIETYSQLIVIAPNNQRVVEDAVRFFIIAGKPDIGEEKAREAIARDPSNPDNYNMLSTACLVQEKPEKNLCAIEALEQVFTLDSTKMDTLNLQKMLFITSRDSATAPAYLKWSQRAVGKFPTNGYFLGELASAYALTGPVDSLVAVTRRLVAADKSNLTPVIRAVRALLAEKRYTEALEFGTVIEQSGEDTDKATLGAVLAQEGGLPQLQADSVDFVLAEQFGSRSVALLREGTRQHQLASYVLGFGKLGQIPAKDLAAVEAKTCEGVSALEQWIAETITALRAGQGIQPEVVAGRIQQLETSYPPRIAQMKKAFCR
ncbi:MAG: tetratricopeptide repeat protein [Gemmatimonadales bacterium]